MYSTPASRGDLGIAFVAYIYIYIEFEDTLFCLASFSSDALYAFCITPSATEQNAQHLQHHDSLLAGHKLSAISDPVPRIRPSKNLPCFERDKGLGASVTARRLQPSDLPVTEIVLVDY